jgi:hypothetical protein
MKRVKIICAVVDIGIQPGKARCQWNRGWPWGKQFGLNEGFSAMRMGPIFHAPERNAGF